MTTKRAPTAVVAGFAVLAASAVLALGRLAPLVDEGLRGTANTWLGATSAVLASSCVAPFVDEGLRETADTLLGAVLAVPTSETNTPQARLGRALFWDVRLSANGQVACASCHTRENWGSDNRPKSTDARDRPTERPFQSVFHSMDASGLRWLGDRDSGAAQAVGSITGSMGFAGHADIVPVLGRQGYKGLFRAAFPDQADPVTSANHGIALQAYQATLRTPAPFDRWLAGDNTAMDTLARYAACGASSRRTAPVATTAPS